MKVWLFTFFILFGAVELYQWLKGFMLPLPIYLLGGAFLAIASNSEKGKGISVFFRQPSPLDETVLQTATLVEPLDLPKQEVGNSPALPSQE